MRFGFIGPTYTSRSPIADCERSVNLYPEIVESGQGKNRAYLIGTPGLRIFGTLPQTPIRAEFAVSDRQFGLGDRFFVVAGGGFYEMFDDGLFQVRGAVTYGTGPASICSNGRQLMIVTGEQAFIYDLTTSGFDPLPLAGPVLMGTSVAGYFIAMRKASRNFNVSAFNDGLSWDELDFEVKDGAPDNIASIWADHGQLWTLGGKTAQVWVSSTDPDHAFTNYTPGFIEQGIAAQFSEASVDNTLMWLGADSRGAGMVWRAAGYTPQRVSNHAVETAIQGYPTIADAEGFSYQEDGHTFYVLRFPSARTTWVYDAANGQWHERTWWSNGQEYSHRARCHTWVFGKHLVGDWENGNVYQQSLAIYDDFGGPIRRMRRAPHISDQMEYSLHRALTLDLETGVGLADGQGSDPQVMLQYSDDGGRTWSNEKWAGAGKIGEYAKRVQWRRLGRARDRVYQVIMTDPVKWALVDAYLDIEPGGRREAA